MKSKEREIIKQDIIDLRYLADMYLKEEKYAKSCECLKEMKKLQSKLKGE